MNVAPEIRAEMAKQRVTVNALAEKVGLSPVTVYRKVVHEERKLTGDEINRMGEALGVPGWELMRRATKEKTAA